MALICPDCNPKSLIDGRFLGTTVTRCVRCESVLSEDDFHRIWCSLCERGMRGYVCQCTPSDVPGFLPPVVEAYQEESGECPDCGQPITALRRLSYDNMSGRVDQRRGKGLDLPALREVRYSLATLLQLVVGTAAIAFLVAIPVGIGVAIWQAVS